MSTLPQIDSRFAFPRRDQATSDDPRTPGQSAMESALEINRLRQTFLSDIAALPRPSRGYFFVKRAIDLTIAIILGIILLPIGLLIAIAIPLDDRGPIFFKQQRTGLGGRRFTMLKFRTMVTNAEELKAQLQHLSLVAYPDFKMDNDPRITRVGRFLRATFLDELPQLINVIRGDMSLVGPRPERPCFVQKFSQELPAYMQRHQVLPGITGWAQVNGWRGDTSLEKRLECDLHYVNHQSFALNLWILLLTPLRVLVERNAC